MYNNVMNWNEYFCDCLLVLFAFSSTSTSTTETTTKTSTTTGGADGSHDSNDTLTIRPNQTRWTTGRSEEPLEREATPVAALILGGLSGGVVLSVIVFLIVVYVSQKRKPKKVYVPNTKSPESTRRVSLADSKKTGSNVMKAERNKPVDAEEQYGTMRTDASDAYSDTSVASSRATEKKRSRSRRDSNDVTSERLASATGRRRSQRRQSIRDESSDAYTEDETTRRTTRRSKRKR